MLGRDEPAALDLGRLFAGLEQAPAVLLAVSGGPDSTALMHLAARWAETRAVPPALHVATVDHGLRPESGAEAETVARAARKLGLAHATLPWLGAKPRTRIQERARIARYRLLGEHAGRLGATHLLTGHHADDQAETILFRLGRGSGLAGLAGMRRETGLAPCSGTPRDLVLARPLLGLRKSTLIAVCAVAGLAYVDDASNRDRVFARGKLRAQADLAMALGLDAPTLNRLGARLARAEDALEAEARRWFSLLEADQEPEMFRARLDPLADASFEILLRVVRLAIAGITRNGKAPRLDRLERLADAVGESLRARIAFHGTLAGTRIVLRADGQITIVPEEIRRSGRSDGRREPRDKPCSWQGE